MKKKICCFFALMLACTGILSGCGAKMYELTEKEEEVIVQYAAYVLGKHNIYQKDGMVKLEPEEYRETQEMDSQIEESESEGAGETSDGGSSEGGSSESEVAVEKSVALAAIAGQEGFITFQYLGYEFMKEYAEGGYFSMEAGEGNEFMVMHFSMKNDSQQEVNVNLMKISPAFFCRVNGDQIYTCEKSLANQDLSTYLAPVKSGEQQEVVLLFKVPEGVSGNVQNLELLFEQNGTKVPVIL